MNRNSILTLIFSGIIVMASAMITSSYTYISDESVNTTDWTNVTINESQIADLQNYQLAGIYNSTSWNRTGTDVFLANAGDKVGIGTASPSKTLHLESSDGTIRLENTGASWYWDIVADSSDNLNFRWAGSDVVTIDPNKRVGIGTTSPSNDLTVYDPSATTTIETKADAGRVSNFKFKSGVIDWYLGNYGTDSYKFKILRDSNEYMTIDTSGKVGIGTTSPNSVLNVYQKADSSGIKLYGYDDQNTKYLHLYLNSAGNVVFDGYVGRNFYFNEPSIFEQAISLYDDAEIQLGSQAEDHYDIYWNDANSRINFDYTGAGPTTTTNMVLTDDGRVGIGTSTPSYPLEVSGNISGISIYASDNISAVDYLTRTSVFDKNSDPFDYILDSPSYLDKEGKIDHTKFYGYAGSYEVTDYSRPVQEEVEECLDTTIPENYTYIEESCDYEKDLKTGNYDLVCVNVTKSATRNKQSCKTETIDVFTFNEETEQYVKETQETEVCEDIIIEECTNQTVITYPYTTTEDAISLNNEIDVLRQALYDLNERVKELEKPGK